MSEERYQQIGKWNGLIILAATVPIPQWGSSARLRLR
jgi:hypothetical protein